MKKLYLLSIILLLFYKNGNSQTITLESDTGYQCHYVFVDVNASGFPLEIGLVQLTININPNQLQYVSRVNGGSINYGVTAPYSNQIRILWTNTNPAISINGLMFTLCLHYDGGTAPMVFNTGPDSSIVQKLDFSYVTTTFVNGGITEGIYVPKIFYVDAARPVSGDGLSWGTAFKTITEAANLALKPGEQVQVKPGTYRERVMIKSNAGYAVRPTTGVILSDTNKITWPNGANLTCVDLVSYPGQYYAYIYRSWSSNNGYYKVIEVNDAQNYVRVEGAAFIPETGTFGNKGKVMAAVGRPVVYRKDPAASESQRVIISAPSGSPADAIYIGLPSGDGQTNADSCNWNLIEGLDIKDTVSGIKGLHIQCSAYNTYAKGRIYSTLGTGAIGAIVTGTSAKQAKYNIIQNNEIYNTPYQGVLLGYTSNTAANNFSNFNHVIDNNFYLSGTSALARFDNAVKVQALNKANVIEGNNFHDIKIFTAANGAVFVGAKSDSTLVYNNILRNIGKDAANSGINAAIMIDSNSYKVYAFNNIIYNDDTVTNAVYAFRIHGRAHTSGKACFNTIYKIDNGFYLRDNAAGAIDFGIQDNIISPTVGYFTNTGGASGRFNVTYNLFRVSPGVPYASGTGNVVGNPLFIEPDGTNMYGMILLPASPAMHTGTAITGITRDYLGELRASPPTMGAFENTMTCTWTGTTNTNWHLTSNWKFLYVPQNYMGVLIPNVTNDPVISAGNATCKSFKLLSGGTIRVVSPRILTINN